MPIAITREVSRSLGDCELSYLDRAAIDVERAIAQHADYCRALESLGCDVIALDAEDAFPDAVFVEDVAIVLDELAVVTRPGAPSRRGEAASVAAALHGHRTLRTIEAPATIDGGDVLRIGRTIYVGESARTSADGVAQLRAITAGFGYAVQPVPIRGCLHLKSAVSELADGIVLINPAWVDRAAFAAFDRIEIDPDEPTAPVPSSTVAPTTSPWPFATKARDRSTRSDAVSVSARARRGCGRRPLPRTSPCRRA
jgi:dimethylargininase